MDAIERYGIPGDDVANLRRRWMRHRLRECGWESFDAFLLWCSQKGFKKSMQIVKLDDNLPHSPENSLFQYRNMKKPVKKPAENPPKQRKEDIGDFCAKCQNKCPSYRVGCKAWEDQWVKNWNENISTSPKLHQSDAARHVWQYEHPDLEREGLRFESTGSL